MDAPHLDRQAVEMLFGVGPRRALLRRVDAPGTEDIVIPPRR